MSVLGIKEWKTNRNLDSHGRVKNGLVLDQYPLQFVLDVARDLGAAFFNSLSTSSIDLATLQTLPEEQLQPKGSLLPFTHLVGPEMEDKFLQNWEFELEEENPTIRSWQIQVTGAVKIDHAAVLTSTLDSENVEMVCNVWLTHKAPDDASPRFNDVRDKGMRFRTVNLRDWVKEYLPFSNNYAVELSRSNAMSRGVLLKEVRRGSRVLVKVGNYITSSLYDLRLSAPETLVKEVEWLVL